MSPSARSMASASHDTHPHPVPSGPPSPWEVEGFIRSDATTQSPSAFPSSGPCGTTFPQGKALGRGDGILPSRMRRTPCGCCAAVGSFAALRMRRTPCGCCAVPPPFDKGGCWTGIPWVHTPTAGGSYPPLHRLPWSLVGAAIMSRATWFTDCASTWFTHFLLGHLPNDRYASWYRPAFPGQYARFGIAGKAG